MHFPLTPALFLGERIPQKISRFEPQNLKLCKWLRINIGILRFMGREERIPSMENATTLDGRMRCGPGRPALRSWSERL